MFYSAMLTTYLFDLDGTLIDVKIYATLYPRVLQYLQGRYHWSESQLDKKAQELGLTKNKQGRWDTGDLCRALGELDAYYTELERLIAVNSVLHDRVEQVLSALKKHKKRVGVVSNSMHRTIQVYLRKYNLATYVDFVFSSDDAECKKKNDAFWRHLIKKEQLTPASCLMVGDTEADDIVPAKKHGFSTLLVKQPADLEKALEYLYK